MGKHKYNFCERCKRIGCPDKEEGLKNPPDYCGAYSIEKLPYPKSQIKDENWRDKVEELNRINNVNR